MTEGDDHVVHIIEEGTHQVLLIEDGIPQVQRIEDAIEALVVKDVLPLRLIGTTVLQVIGGTPLVHTRNEYVAPTEKDL